MPCERPVKVNFVRCCHVCGQVGGLQNEMQSEAVEVGAGEALEPRKQLLQKPAGGALRSPPGRSTAPWEGCPDSPTLVQCRQKLSVSSRYMVAVAHLTWFDVFWVNEEFHVEDPRGLQLTLEQGTVLCEKEVWFPAFLEELLYLLFSLSRGPALRAFDFVRTNHELADTQLVLTYRKWPFSF